jgi:hypothetical protein
MAALIGFLDVFFLSLIGVWLGRRYHHEFLAHKLARMPAKVETEAASQRQSTLQMKGWQRRLRQRVSMPR